MCPVLVFAVAWGAFFGFVGLSVEIVFAGPAAAFPFFPRTRLP